MKEVTLPRKDLSVALSATLMFRNLQPDDIDGLAALVEVYDYDDGEFIVTQHSASRYLYAIMEGRCDITVKGPDRKDVFLAHLDAGDVFGESSIFMEVQRTANVVSDGKSRVLAFSRAKLIDYINNRPAAGLKIFSFIIYGLLHKLASSNKDLAWERESRVTEEDLKSLMDLFPKTIDQIVK